jgi:hypothetical protein
VAAHASAQTIDKTILVDYDLDSTTLLYPCLSEPFDSGSNRAATTGTSTTLASVPATGAGAFRNLAIGDQMSFNIGGTLTVVYVTAKASDFSITVSSALTLGTTGLPFTYRNFTSGTGDICWTNLRGYPKKSITIEYNQGDLTGGLNWRVECKSNQLGAQPIIVWPASSLSDCGPGAYVAGGYCNIPTASAGITGRVQWQDDSVQGLCRVGMYGVTGDASDAGANLEKISVFISADVRK